MNLFKRGPKKIIENSDRLLVDPANMPQPQTVSDYMRRGYAYYARSKFPEAEGDFKKAMEIEPKAVDAIYALGMSLKAQGRKDDSIQAFQQVIDMIGQGAIENKVRANMLRRLALGHINEIKEGDWNLEKEIWHRAE